MQGERSPPQNYSQDRNMFYYGASISYDGTNFCGFQIQKNERTVQGELEKALRKIEKREIRIGFAGRTDSHVHALENIITFNLSKEFSPEQLPRILNSILPHDIRVNKTFTCPSHFNPRYDSYKRVYVYVICNSKIMSPFTYNHAVHYPFPVNMELLNNLLSLFEGCHNFRGYTSSAEKRDPMRTLYNCFAVKKHDFIYIYISGAAFLHKQIRSITGAVFEIMKTELKLNHSTDSDKGNQTLEEMKQKISQSLQKGSTPFNYTVFHPQGLYLKKVIWHFDKTQENQEFIS